MMRSACALLTVAALCAAPAVANEAAPEEPTARVVHGSVERATFATAIVDREPEDSVETLPNTHGQVFFFSELHGLEGQTVLHRWEREGVVMAEVPFHVRSSRWRVYSSKNLLPDWTGEWSVSVVDEAGHVLEVKALHYERATAAADRVEATTPPASAADADSDPEPAAEAGTPRDAMGEEMWRP